MNRSHGAAFALGAVLCAAIAGGLLFRRHRVKDIDVDAGTAGVSLAGLRALPLARSTKRPVRTVVTVVPPACNCEADLDALVELQVSRERFHDARLVFVTSDAAALDLEERAKKLHVPRAPGASERYEQLFDLEGAAISIPYAVKKVTTFVLDEHGGVLALVSPLDPYYVERVTLAADLKPRHGWEAKGDPKRAEETPNPAYLGAGSSGWCEVMRDAKSRAELDKLLKAKGAAPDLDEKVEAKITAEIGASGWLNRVDVHVADPALATAIRWDVLRRIHTYRYERASGPVEIMVTCRAVPLRRWAQ